ncbi:hypothetical protein [Mesobacterium pallidum]|uniref:hypothetical protein n=1 Tax=Mesobacterium pallidum TaxID=2872037 RepID=UPI001EE33E2C|nr:hypothetical protein [Mesobacterium pallidum]
MPRVVALLDAEAGAIDGAFILAADALLAGRDKLMELTECLRAYEAGLEGLSAQTIQRGLDGLAGGLEETTASVDREFSDSTRIMMGVVELDGPLGSLSSQVRMLESYSSTARVVEAELGLADKQAFSHELGMLTKQSLQGYEVLDGCAMSLLKTIRAILDQQKNLRSKGLKPLAKSCSMLETMASRIAPALQAALEDSRGLNQVTQRLHSGTSSCISSLQVGDSFRQRLEHVAEALRRLGSAPAPLTADLIRDIGAAQLVGAARALDRDLSQLGGDIDTISADMGHLLGRVSSLREGSELSRLLATLEGQAGGVLAKLYALRTERRALERRLAEMRTTVIKMDSILADQAGIDQDMKMGSYNVSLRGRNFAGNSAVLSTVARQTGELVDACLASRVEIVRGIEGIRDMIETAGMRDARQMTHDLDDISDQLGGLARPLALWRDFDASLAGLMVAGAATVAELRQIGQRLSNQRATVDAIIAAGSDLSDPQRRARRPQAVADPDAMAAAAVMRTLYSVPEERDIHDRICTGGHAGHMS